MRLTYKIAFVRRCLERASGPRAVWSAGVQAVAYSNKELFCAQSTRQDLASGAGGHKVRICGGALENVGPKPLVATSAVSCVLGDMLQSV